MCNLVPFGSIAASHGEHTTDQRECGGDEQAGGIFVKIDTLDGFAKLFSRNIKYDLNNDKEIIEFIDLYPLKKITSQDIDKRISIEIEIDRDCWVVEIEDRKGFNAFENLDC